MSARRINKAHLAMHVAAFIVVVVALGLFGDWLDLPFALRAGLGMVVGYFVGGWVLKRWPLRSAA